MTSQDELAAEVLNGFTPIGEVPDQFSEFVQERIAARPSPKPADDDPLVEVNRKLDAILTLLGGTPE